MAMQLTSLPRHRMFPLPQKHSSSSFQSIFPWPSGKHHSDFFQQRLILPVLELHVNQIVHDVYFCVWLFFTAKCIWCSFVLLRLSVIHSYLLLSSILLYDCNSFIHSLVEGHVGHFQFAAIMNKADTNILAQVLLYTYFHFSWVNTSKRNCWIIG